MASLSARLSRLPFLSCTCPRSPHSPSPSARGPSAGSSTCSGPGTLSVTWVGVFSAGSQPPAGEVLLSEARLAEVTGPGSPCSAVSLVTSPGCQHSCHQFGASLKPISFCCTCCDAHFDEADHSLWGCRTADRFLQMNRAGLALNRRPAGPRGASNRPHIF